MRRAGLLALALLCTAATLAGCTAPRPDQGDAGVRAGGPGPDTTDPRTSLRDVLIGGSEAGLTAIDSTDGSILFAGVATPAMGNWLEAFATESQGKATRLFRVAPSSGERVAAAELRGAWEVRAAGHDGRLVALMRPLPEGAKPEVPVSRSTTPIMIVDATTGSDAPKVYRLDGNFEPEAFSMNGTKLFMIRHIPAMNPTAYRVAVLDLRTGHISPVATPTKSGRIVETMAGTRMHQVADPDGDALYTLYTSEPPAYAADSDAVKAAHEDVSFIHTLNMRQGWAHCIGLPRQLWEGRSTDEAIAISPSGALVYVVDTARDFVAVMDPRELRVTDRAEVDFGEDVLVQSHAVISADGKELIVGNGRRVVVIDALSLEPVQEWTSRDDVTGLAAAPGRLYVAMNDQVDMVDPASGKQIRSTPAPGLEDLYYAGSLRG